MGIQSKLAKDILNGASKTELFVAAFFKVHPYLEPTNDTNQTTFILAFDNDEDASLECFNEDLRKSLTKIANESQKYKGDISLLTSHMFLKLVNH